MDLDMWFRDDVANLLRAALLAGQLMRGQSDEFQRGYLAALYIMAQNFGIAPGMLQPPVLMNNSRRQTCDS